MPILTSFIPNSLPTPNWGGGSKAGLRTSVKAKTKAKI